MRALALEPFYGGSHRAFLDGWVARSRHCWTVLGLPATHWKWRMRGGALALAEQVEERRRSEPGWDVIFASDMLDLAAFRALAPASVARLPAVLYFHENQLTYPVRAEVERDLHFAFTNLTSALAAHAVWFNSSFHRREWSTALEAWIGRMPAPRPRAAIAAVAAKSSVEPPGVVVGRLPEDRWAPAPAARPLRIVWAARWEFDKAPERFFAALRSLADRGTDFRVSVLGERFAQAPEVFEQARRELTGRIDHWGYVEEAERYRQALARADVFVSTADHEFFGLSAVEAAACGLRPLLPRRLAYPELFPDREHEGFFYGGSAATREAEVEELADRLEALARRFRDHGTVWQGEPDRAAAAAERFDWRVRAPALDAALEAARAAPSEP